MTFSEEVPPNFKPSCPCKRRGCPLQRYYEVIQLNAPPKRYFTYQCSKPEIWAVCNKTIAPNETDPTKPKPPTPPPTPEPKKDEIGGYPCKKCSYLAPTEFLLNKHMDCNHKLNLQEGENMKCKKCGHKTQTIKAMGEHYRKKHPNQMKAKTEKKHSQAVPCELCGEYIPKRLMRRHVKAKH